MLGIIPRKYLPAAIEYVNIYRNLKGRYDLMRFLYRWDSDYCKDVMVTTLNVVLLFYSIITWNNIYDIVMLLLGIGIIVIEFGGDMSILPADYRPRQGGMSYSIQNSTHVAYDELSFSMGGIQPAPVEAALGYCNPIAGMGLCRETPLVSSAVDDMLMTRKSMPYTEDKAEKNLIFSRHQLRYIAIRVANKKTPTTNEQLLSFMSMADAIADENSPVEVRKSCYFEALMTHEAFRSRLFRGNIQHETEVYTDLTTYFPVKKEASESGGEILRFRPDFYKRVSGLMGVTGLILTENKRVAMLYQGTTKVIGASQVCFGGAGAASYADIRKSGYPGDFRDVIAYSMAREVCEETGMMKYFPEARRNTMVTGIFRWIDRCGLPEFVGITRAGNVPFSKEKAIDHDEVVRFDEVPVTIRRVEDFNDVMVWTKENKGKVSVALASIMALHRLTVIAGYGRDGATDRQKQIYKKVSEFIGG